jgi:hypothetical protein
LITLWCFRPELRTSPAWKSSWAMIDWLITAGSLQVRIADLSHLEISWKMIDWFQCGSFRSG